MDIHSVVKSDLHRFVETNKIPNIIFHGPTGSGKRTLVNYFINLIYKNKKDQIKEYVMYVDCAQGKGIKFVREELKFFAKSHINISKTHIFKTIVMSNADKLTIDAQSALRRCIEVYNHTTRFFIVIEDKYKLLKPILSRFCEICISSPEINNERVNLNKHIVDTYIDTQKVEKKRVLWLEKELDKKSKTLESIFKKTEKIYEKSYSALDVMEYIENCILDDSLRWSILLSFHKVKKEFRNEKLLIFFILNYLYFRSEINLENILIM